MIVSGLSCSDSCGGTFLGGAGRSMLLHALQQQHSLLKFSDYQWELELGALLHFAFPLQHLTCDKPESP